MLPSWNNDFIIIYYNYTSRLDAALIHVSRPDQHGFCSLGTSVDCTRAAVQHAKYIIGERTTFQNACSSINNVKVYDNGFYAPVV